MPTTRLTPATAPPEPVTLARAKEHLRISFADQDGYVSDLIATARAEAENRVQRSLVPSPYRLALDCFPQGFDCITLAMPPVQQVTAVTYWTAAGQTAALAPSQWLLDGISEPARLVPAPGTHWPTDVQARPGAVWVDYTAGYPTPDAVPLPIKQWILLAIGDMDAQRNRSSERPFVPQLFADSLLDVYRIFNL